MNGHKMMQVENTVLHEQLDQLVEELEIVNWYIQVLEGGNNTKTLLKDFVKAQAEIKMLKENFRYTKNKL